MIKVTKRGDSDVSAGTDPYSPLHTGCSRLYPADSDLKALCLEMVFTRLSGNISSEEWRFEAIRLSHRLFEELKQAKYEEW